jgi:prepilin-type N-terminal cleavage/methylation domain-containing protein
MAGVWRHKGPRSSRAGFTLIELSLVVFIIAVMLSIAMPRVLPAITMSELEGSARRMAGYGRSLVAYCALSREPATFRMDLDKGEVWSERWVLEADAEEEQESDAFARAPAAYGANASAKQAELDAFAQDMEEQFERFIRLNLEAQSRMVKEDSILSETEPLFEEEFDLEWEDQEQEVEIKTDLLQRTRLPEGVRFEKVLIGAEEHTAGAVEVEVTAYGLVQPLAMVLAAEDERYTVVWDAVTGNTRVSRGDLTAAVSLEDAL